VNDQPTQPGPPNWATPSSPSAPPPQQQWAPPPPTPLPGWHQQQPPPPPRRRRRINAAILIAGGIGLLLVLIAVAIPSGEEPAGQATATTAATPSLLSQPTSPPATDPPAPTFATPTPRDFKLTVKVVKKENFGSAGSNITYRIDAAWSKTFDPDKTYEVTYEVRGGEDGPAVNTLTVTGDEYQREREEFISTSSVGQKLTARVTSVDEV